MLPQSVAEALESGSGSDHGVSDTSIGFAKPSKHPNVQNKRKGADPQAPPLQRKRLRAHYNEGYRQLYNETVNEIVREPPSDHQELLPPSQIGITMWSSEEKDSFFTALAKKGRGNLPGIADSIGTKSEFEVHVYIKLLQDAVVRQHLHSPRNHLFDVSAAPAAFEVSPECSAALELSADTLSVIQKKAEVKCEKKEHHDMWLLNRKIGRWASLCLRQGVKGEKEVQERLAAAKLLDLEAFLKLSTEIFMNSNQDDGNWREYCAKGEKPSIRFTAFADFHRMVISITKRLIQTSLFLAMSRRRATTTPNFTPKQAVRKQDIVAALNVLGMKHNSRRFWTGVARRCALDVYDDDDDDDDNGEEAIHRSLSFSEVEKRLSQGGIKDKDNGHGIHNTEETKKTTATRSSISPSSPSSSSSSSSSTPPNPRNHPPPNNLNDLSSPQNPPSSPSPSPPNTPSPSDQDSDPDIYAEALDKKASTYEEQRLWTLLNQEPPEPLHPDAIPIPRAPPREREKKGDKLDDWRAWTDYVPEWEGRSLR